MWLQYCLVLLFCYFFRPSSQQNECKRIDRLIKGEGYLELMNSPTLKAWGRHQLRVIYQMDRRLPGDKVKVFQESPTKEVVFEALVPSADFIDTDVTNEVDYKYSAEYLRSDGTVVAASELTNWSGWMNCLREYLGPRSVGQTLFPGTHDAGSYKLPRELQTVSPTTLLDNYVYTQDEKIEDQLERGARYLDLRIAHYPNMIPFLNQEVWWINHNMVKIRPLINVIQQIKSFLSRWPNEIIILDLHRFPMGFTDEKVHDELVKYLKEEFGSLIHYADYPPWQITFNQIWNSTARILLSYNKADVATKYNFFPPITQIWANTDEADKLFSYIDTHVPKNCAEGLYRMTSVMAELTSQVLGVIERRYNLRSLAYDVNANITLGFTKGSWGRTAQAVAVDYLSSTGIISAAILQNVQRAKSDQCN